MEGSPDSMEEIPKIDWPDYVTSIGLLDEHAAVQRTRSYDTVTEEFYGELEGWEDETHKFITILCRLK